MLHGSYRPDTLRKCCVLADGICTMVKKNTQPYCSYCSSFEVPQRHPEIHVGKGYHYSTQVENLAMDINYAWLEICCLNTHLAY